MNNNQDAGAVEKQDTFRVIAPTEEKQRITSDRIEKLDHQETNGNGDQITTQKRIGTVTNCRETGEGQRKGANAGICIKPPHYALTDITEKTDTSLVTQGWVGDKPCRVTVDTGTYVTIARPDIAARWPERQPHPGFKLQTVSGESLPILKEVLLTHAGAPPAKDVGVRREYHQ
jgi:hypothetical protein